MKKIVKNSIAAVLLTAAAGPAFGQFSKTAFDSEETTTANARDIKVGEETTADTTNPGTTPGGPGNPRTVPIDGITGVLIVTGAAIILASGRKRAPSRL